MKLSAFNLQEVLVVLVIIGILMLLVLPNLMPLISKVKSTEAQLQLKHLHNAQTMHHYMHSKYNISLSDIDFDPPKTVNENGSANYAYELISADNHSFLARATAVTDFDGDGIYNIWEITELGQPKQIVKD